MVTETNFWRLNADQQENERTLWVCVCKGGGCILCSTHMPRAFSRRKTWSPGEATLSRLWDEDLLSVMEYPPKGKESSTTGETVVKVTAQRHRHTETLRFNHKVEGFPPTASHHTSRLCITARLQQSRCGTDSLRKSIEETKVRKEHGRELRRSETDGQRDMIKWNLLNAQIKPERAGKKKRG